MASEYTELDFSLDNFRDFQDIPSTALDQLTDAVYILDYSWRFLFVNERARSGFSDFVGTPVGQNALEIFRGPTFTPIFERVKDALESQRSCYLTVYSPFRRKVILKGHPLRDCYFISLTVSPGKEELIEELRGELAKRKL